MGNWVLGNWVSGIGQLGIRTSAPKGFLRSKGICDPRVVQRTPAAKRITRFRPTAVADRLRASIVPRSKGICDPRFTPGTPYGRKKRFLHPLGGHRPPASIFYFPRSTGICDPRFPAPAVRGRCAPTFPISLRTSPGTRTPRSGMAPRASGGQSSAVPAGGCPPARPSGELPAPACNRPRRCGCGSG